jgi:tetratricopeptide (TPR) repeat protein
MKALLIVLILTIATMLLFSCSADKKKAIEHYNKAKELYENDNIMNASSEIDLAIKLDSSNLDFQIIKAKIIKETDNYELAIKILEALASKNFKLDTVNFNIGDCYLSYARHFTLEKNDEEKANDSYEKALNFYNNAININSQYFDAYKSKQKVLHNLERYNEALVVINTAINLFPDSTSFIRDRGIEKIYLGDLTGGMTDLNNSIQSNKLDSFELATAYRFRGIIFLKKGKLDEAINDLTNALKYDPQNGYALAIRANCYKEKGLKDKACEDYRKAADLGFIRIYKTIKEYCVE